MNIKKAWHGIILSPNAIAFGNLALFLGVVSLIFLAILPEPKVGVALMLLALTCFLVALAQGAHAQAREDMRRLAEDMDVTWGTRTPR